MREGRIVTSRAQHTDEQLALAVQAGDVAAERELVDRYTGLAYKLAWPYATLRSDFDDMRQEALLGILGAARSYRPDPHDALIRNERLRTFVDFVTHQLSPIEREALVGFLNGRSLTDIHESLGRSLISRYPDGRQRPKTAENALDRARAKLRVALEEPRPLGAAA